MSYTTHTQTQEIRFIFSHDLFQMKNTDNLIFLKINKNKQKMSFHLYVTLLCKYTPRIHGFSKTPFSLFVAKHKIYEVALYNL